MRTVFKVLPDACSKHRCDSETSDVVPDSLRVLRDVACSSTSMGNYSSIMLPFPWKRVVQRASSLIGRQGNGTEALLGIQQEQAGWLLPDFKLSVTHAQWILLAWWSTSASLNSTEPRIDPIAFTSVKRNESQCITWTQISIISRWKLSSNT